MPLANYTDLLAAVADHVHRGDLAGVIPDLVQIAESRINREVISHRMDAEAALTLASGTRTAALPADFLILRQLTAEINGYTTILQAGDLYEVPVDVDDTVIVPPEYFRINGLTLLFDAIADQTYTITLLYRAKLALAATSTNWLMTEYPEVYLYGAKAEAYRYAEDHEQAQIHDGLFVQAMFDVNRQLTKNLGRPTLTVEFEDNNQFNIYTGDYNI